VRLLALAASVWPTSASADALQSLANQRNMLPGGRASMLGGAYTAVSDDSSGSYYNPAGLAFIKENRLELSATGYRTSNLIYHETVGDEPFDERSETIYPSFFGGTAKLSALTLGYSFMTLDARNVYQQNQYDNISSVDGAPSSYSRTYQEASTYIWAGGSAALRLSGNWSVGTSVFYYQRNIEFSTNELILLNGGGILSINDTLKTLNTGLAGSNGIMYRGESISFGASIRTAMSFSNKSTLLVDIVDYDPVNGPRNAEDDVLPTVTHTRAKHRALNELNPTTYTLGMAWHPASWFLLSTDVMLHEGVKSRYKQHGGHDLHTTFNYSLGMELNAGWASLMAGYLTNSSMYRAPDPELVNQPVHIDYVGYTGGLGWSIGGVHGQLGAMVQSGKGEAQILSGSTDIQNVEGRIATYVLAGKVPL
jgi:long-chain fatty acid transport protein